MYLQKQIQNIFDAYLNIYLFITKTNKIFKS